MKVLLNCDSLIEISNFTSVSSSISVNGNKLHSVSISVFQNDFSFDFSLSEWFQFLFQFTLLFDIFCSVT